jgi:CheY-like chemotaxis protein
VRELLLKTKDLVKVTPVILVVDDDPDVAGVVAAMLRQLGFRVISATKAQTALSACENSETPIDLLITDFQMPEMNGQQLARLVRARQPGMKVLYMTTDVAPLQSPQEQELRCLSKPFDFVQLRVAVSLVLNDAAPQ